VVSDSFDLWQVCTKFVTELKDEIMSRDGKLVIRPDSGNPVDILCGSLKWETKGEFEFNKNRIIGLTPEEKGVIELLWDVFGGTINEQGYKVLDPHIGAIYGDSITIDRADEICARLASKGFASTNVVLGIGSFTYQFNTRDTFGFAMKATYVELEVPMYGDMVDQGLNTKIVGREIFKDPITDDGTKKSATGLLAVFRNDNDGSYQLHDHCNWETEKKGELKTIYMNGEFHNQTTLTEIRERLK
jgi:nicotinamide phosphoribosyltransferase